jgi:D-aminoacyl-tRNA deacylase
VARAQGLDEAAAREAIEANAVAFGTTQAGTRAAGRVAFAADDAAPGHADLVADLAAVLAADYDEVVVDDDAVIARETAFDPALAADMGVPEGPAFGRLASGEPVEVDGETVRPEAVSTRREERFPTE